MAPKLELPKSNHTVRVRMVDTTALMTIASQSFVDPVQPGHELINITDVAFLIEHETSGKKVMFDLGCRKDYWNLPAVIQKRLGDVIPSLKVDKDVSEVLEGNSIPLESLCESTAMIARCVGTKIHPFQLPSSGHTTIGTTLATPLSSLIQPPSLSVPA